MPTVRVGFGGPMVRATEPFTGRIAYDGRELEPLDESEVEQAFMHLKDTGVQAVAICFMHSYANNTHEKRALEIVKKHWLEAYVCTSSGVLSEFREYKRFITTVVNTSLMPMMDKYVDRFATGVRALGIPCEPRVMQSNGGAVTTGTVRRMPVNTFFSGLAGGVMATVALGRFTSLGNLIAFDMGGTSTDVCLDKDIDPTFKNERAMAGLPVRTRTLYIHTVGAGGGSIAWLGRRLAEGRAKECECISWPSSLWTRRHVADCDGRECGVRPS